MIVSQVIAIIAVLICIVALLSHFLKLVKLGKPNEFSQKRGNVSKSVAYSSTVSMLPNHKESAMLHLPTYGLGIVFHVGTFTSLLLFVLSFFPFFNHWIEACMLLNTVLPALIAIAVFAGIALFGKRLISKDLRSFSTPDDYLSNGLTTLFQLESALFLFCHANNYIVNSYYLMASLLFLYMPLGKLRHVVFFFAARYHLGFFYGWRGSWPPRKKINNE
jgi:nitrate reductase gamma subunit